MNAPTKEFGRANPYLGGNFAPVRSEDDFADLKVVGAIPPELCGSYFRNGPNPQFDPRDSNYHWFAGDGMIHAFTVSNGKVSYRNRYVKTPKWELENAAGKALFGTFGNPMTSDPQAAMKDSGVANTNIVWHAGRLLALEEGHQPFELDPRSLASRGYRDYAGRAKRFTAHPKIDPATRDLVAAILEDGIPAYDTMLAFGIETEWHFEALFYAFWEGDFTAEELDACRGDGEKLTELVFKAPNNPHRFITFIMRQ